MAYPTKSLGVPNISIRKDSASYYAKLCVTENEQIRNDNWYSARAYSILGEQEKSESILTQYFLSDSEMIHGQVALAKRTIECLVLSKNYAEATEMLIELNRDFPQLGKYIFLSEFSFDRAKKEYPPFAKAVANLKMPPPFVEDNQLERLKY